MCCKTPEKPATRELNFSGNEDPRKRTKSFKNLDAKNESSMSVMMKEDASYLDNAVVSKSKAKLFKELTCIVMQSSNYIKTLPEVDEAQLAKKVCLPYTKDHQSG
mmetsp:Transcript_38461/g.44076  ORF Transcript_38461/g.44076 Transcript_38461/m.44076 type:complete len:105 (+) Transcript_38461:226-540(+)